MIKSNVNRRFDVSNIILETEVVNVKGRSCYVRVEFEMDCISVWVKYVNVLIIGK